MTKKTTVGTIRTYYYSLKGKTNKVKRYYIDTYDEKGERIRIYGFDTKTAANDKLSEITAAKASNNFIYSSKDLTFNYLANNCLNNYAKTLKQSTYKNYKSLYNTHLKPYFGHLKYKNITASTLNNFYIEKKEDGLSEKTIYNIRAFLSTIFRFNIDDKKITQNPVNTSVKIEYETEEVIPYTPEEQKLLLTTAKEYKDAYYIIKLFLETGMRRGELVAFDLSKLDRIKMQYKLRYSSFNKELCKPKTKQGRRDINLSPEALKVIEDYLKIRSVNSNFLFPAPDGGLRCADALNDMFERVKNKAGITHGSIHTLRHTYASNQIAKGKHPKYICVQMGHYSITVTMDIYGHLFPLENEPIQEQPEQKSILELSIQEIESKEEQLQQELALLSQRKNELNGSIDIKKIRHLRLVK